MWSVKPFNVTLFNLINASIWICSHPVKERPGTGWPDCDKNVKPATLRDMRHQNSRFQVVSNHTTIYMRQSALERCAKAGLILEDIIKSRCLFKWCCIRKSKRLDMVSKKVHCRRDLRGTNESLQERRLPCSAPKTGAGKTSQYFVIISALPREWMHSAKKKGCDGREK